MNQDLQYVRITESLTISLINFKKRLNMGTKFQNLRILTKIKRNSSA